MKLFSRFVLLILGLLFALNSVAMKISPVNLPVISRSASPGESITVDFTDLPKLESGVRVEWSVECQYVSSAGSNSDVFILVEPSFIDQTGADITASMGDTYIYTDVAKTQEHLPTFDWPITDSSPSNVLVFNYEQNGSNPGPKTLSLKNVDPGVETIISVGSVCDAIPSISSIE